MSFTWGKATITARALTIGDEEVMARLQSKLPGETLMMTLEPFAEFMVAASIEGEPPLPMVTAVSPDSEVQASYVAWGGLPRAFKRQWVKELREVEAPPKNE